MIDTASPTALKSFSVCFKSAGVALEPATATEMPRPTSTGVFGITRTTRACPPRPASSRRSGNPAAIEMKSFRGFTSGRTSSSSAAMTCGLTARMTVCDRRTSSRLSRVTSILWARFRRRSCASTGSLAHMSAAPCCPASSIPRMRAVAMLPAPTKPIFFINPPAMASGRGVQRARVRAGAWSRPPRQPPQNHHSFPWIGGVVQPRGGLPRALAPA